MEEKSIIEVKNISKIYGNKVILKNINLKINKGEFITVIGSSGCGKTTFLKLINGLIEPDDGKVYVEGNDISKVDKIALRRKIGYVIQEIGLFPHMTVRKNISYVPNLIKKEKKDSIENRVKELINKVGLKEERQRVGIARALAINPNIILMDEPFGAIDEITRKLLQDEILKIYKEYNMTIIFITHDIKEALKLGTRIMVMDKGEVIQIDTPEQLIKNPKNIFVKELLGDNKIS